MTRIELFLFRALGQHDGFYTRPSLDNRKFYFHTNNLVLFNNDGHEVWMGTSDNWSWHTTHPNFRRIVFWYLYQWCVVDWFGLRSWLWFKLLGRRIHRRVSKS